MNKQAVIGIIRKILAYYGYNISSPDISDLLAEKDSDHLFVKFETAVNFNSIRHFSNNVQKYEGKGILILESVDEKTRSFALDQGLTLWDRNELESWVGRAVLSGALGEHFRMPPIKKDVVFPSTAARAQVRREPVKKEYEKTIRISLHSVPVKIGKLEALSIAEAKVGRSQSWKLKFIPLWHYSFSFNIQKTFKSRTVDLIGDGEGYIHAFTGENSFVKLSDIQDNIFVPTHNYEIKQPSLAKNDAMRKALDAIIRAHSKEIRLNEMIGDTIIFENKVFSPDSEAINLNMELLHIPVWEIRGMGETIEINGYNGQIIAVEAYSDAEFV